jgi:hypothetical protein
VPTVLGTWLISGNKMKTPKYQNPSIPERKQYTITLKIIM